MEHLLSCWPEIKGQLQNAKHILLLSDYDGTLTPIVERPEAAIIPDDTRQLLTELASRPDFKVGMISGRSTLDLKNMVRIKGIIYVGNHGFEIDGPGLRFINPVAAELKPILHIIRQLLTTAVGTIKGAFVEDKGLTLSVHYRQVDDEQASQVRNIVEKAINGKTIRGMVKITHGKKVYEVRPAVSWDKGKAIRLLMKRYGKGGRESGLLPIYLGDDLTDEDGFKTIERYGQGISVYVGGINESSAARYYLNSPNNVCRFLDLLLGLPQRTSRFDRIVDYSTEIDFSHPSEITG